MAINKTGAIFKGLTFDGESCKDYGIHITGEAVYNAPEREVEMVTIPGRNGQFALDMGRFENIEVTYPAGLFASTESDFSEAISDFRNLLCSKRGYVRLQDDYNPNEYRMAVYKSGLELEPLQSKAGEFEITFDCKPQRYLTSGETENTVANNGTLTNPTLFDSEPLLKVKGYGTIRFNGYEIELENGYIGTVDLWNSSRVNSVNTTISKSFNTNMFNPTDTFTFYVEVGNSTIYEETSSVTSTNANATYDRGDNNDGSISLYVHLPCTFTVGTPSTITNTTTATYIGGRTTVFAMTVAYDGTGNVTYTTSTTHSTGVSAYNPFTYIPDCSGDSTLTRLGNPTYIDCELGECYKFENNTLVSLNEFIDLGSDLPKLAPGTNTFTKDNTITELKVISRWWKV